jgi:hypothetical protein
VLVGVKEALQGLEHEVPAKEQTEFARVSKRGEVDIVVSTVPADDVKSLPSVDVREYVDTERYTGPTKKGVRFPWERLPEVIALLQIQAERLGADETNERTLFPLARPKWVEKAQEPKRTSTGDGVVAELLPNGPRSFPKEFVEGQERQMRMSLPTEPVGVAQLPDGKCVIRSDFGFCEPVRNVTEGKFILYAHLRGHKAIEVPQEMIGWLKGPGASGVAMGLFGTVMSVRLSP